ncbi:unnamed protein product [Rotaria sp. Silwood1]|nr:unnamed protein product [Rotaria sp. Silwood1]CAF1278805.1 unnamed protein product [Rotaria sp. Silwood1]CAF4993654.1 unnamed protein product [Rotaria sp. Silwood1]
MNYIETNKTITTTTSILKTPSENAQGHEYELLSPTQVLTGQKQKQEPVQPQKGEEMANHEIEQITTNGTSDNKRSKPKREINHNNDYSYISDYLQVTNRIFKQMLISSLEGADKIVKR